MERRLPWLLLASSVLALFAACDLNPQPLPPVDDDEKNGTPTAGNASSSSGGGFEGSDPNAPSDSADAGTGKNEDAGDGGDASSDGGLEAAPDADTNN